MMGKAADAFLNAEVLPHVERIENHDMAIMAELMRKAIALIANRHFVRFLPIISAIATARCSATER